MENEEIYPIKAPEQKNSESKNHKAAETIHPKMANCMLKKAPFFLLYEPDSGARRPTHPPSPSRRAVVVLARAPRRAAVGARVSGRVTHKELSRNYTQA